MTDSSSGTRSERLPSGLNKVGRVLFGIVFVALVISNVMLQREVRRLRANLRTTTLTLLRRGTIREGTPLPVIALQATDGRTTTLSKLGATTTLVAFVDPECDACKELIAEAGKNPASSSMAFVGIRRAGSSSLLTGTPASSQVFYATADDDAQVRHLIGRVPRVLLMRDGRVVRLCDHVSECTAPVAPALGG